MAIVIIIFLSAIKKEVYEKRQKKKTLVPKWWSNKGNGKNPSVKIHLRPGKNIYTSLDTQS